MQGFYVAFHRENRVIEVGPELRVPMANAIRGFGQELESDETVTSVQSRGVYSP